MFMIVPFAWGLGQHKKVTVRVMSPALTPADARLFIAGNSADLGNWDPGKVQLSKESEKLWSITTGVPVGSVLEFKITRGSWSTEAVYIDGAIPQNTVVVVRSDTVISLRPVTWNDLSTTRQNRTRAGGITGKVKYHRGVKGMDLKNDRDLIVWLPPSYEKESSKRYPVLYMHDGQNVFDPSTSFLGYDWRADEVADSLIRSGAIEEIIIVGINNSPERMQEYADTPLGRSYARFVAYRVKPLIDSLYRTKPDRGHTAVMGSSMGGLISMMLLAWHPDVFSRAGCLSSSIGFGIREQALEKMFADDQVNKGLFIYMDVGELENGLVPGNSAFATFLQNHGFEPGKNFEYFFAKGAVHNEPAWAHRLWRPMRFMFGR
jgi:predicted alpha/beta superfamily hydrolase